MYRINRSLHHIATTNTPQKFLTRSTNTIKQNHTSHKENNQSPWPISTPNQHMTFLHRCSTLKTLSPSCASPRHPLVSPHNSVSCNSAVKSHGNPPQLSGSFRALYDSQTTGPIRIHKEYGNGMGNNKDRR